MRKYLFILCLTLLSSCSHFQEVDTTQFEVDNKTVLDTKSKLMWAASDNTQSLTWQEAVDYCESYSGDGYQDWRMPGKAELQTLIDARIEKDSDVINITSNLIWASEVDDSKAAFCHFKNRGCSWMEKVISISFRALPVRDTTADTTVTDPIPEKPQSTEQRLQVLDMLHKQQLITDDEYTQKKAAILNDL